MLERMVEVWLNRKNLDDFMNEKECEGYMTNDVRGTDKSIHLFRCLVSADSVKKKNDKISVRGGSCPARLVEVWIREDNFFDFTFKKGCVGYNTSGIENVRGIASFGRCLVPVGLIEKIVDDKIYIMDERTKLKTSATSPRGACIK